MARLAIDFNKVNNKKYQLYRVMQTSDIWSRIYRDRIKAYSKYRTAIIFPEALLGLNQNNVYCPRYSKANTIINVTISSIPLSRFMIFDIATDDFTPIKNLEQIEKFENATTTNDFVAYLHFTQSGLNLPFADCALFSSKNDAIRFAITKLE